MNKAMNSKLSKLSKEIGKKPDLIKSYWDIKVEEGRSFLSCLVEVLGEGFLERLEPITEPLYEPYGTMKLMDHLTNEELDYILTELDKEEENINQ